MSRPPHPVQRVAIVGLVIIQVAALAAGAAWAASGDQLIRLMREVRAMVDLAPPPDREIPDAVEITPRPSLAPTPRPTPPPTLEPGATASPVPTPAPTPVRKRVDYKIPGLKPATMFASQVDNTMCAPAGVQMVLAMHGLANNGEAFQKKLDSELVDRWESRKDAKAGGWGPNAMAEALADYGATGYEVRYGRNRMDVLRDAAVQLRLTKAPVILIAWKGAHTWVMTGFRADADPVLFPDATILGAYIYDPWYPRRSVITLADGTQQDLWGPSEPAGSYQDLEQLKFHFLEWKRPEGDYPDRDGRFITIVPTIPRADDAN